MKGNLKARDLARMSDSYKSTLGRVAYEKSRAKPEDVMSSNFAKGFLVAFLGFLKRFASLFGKHKREVHRTHARGFARARVAGKASRILPPSKALRHPGEFTRERLAAIRKAKRLARLYALRGYGFIDPYPIKLIEGKNAERGYAKAKS